MLRFHTEIPGVFTYKLSIVSSDQDNLLLLKHRCLFSVILFIRIKIQIGIVKSVIPFAHCSKMHEIDFILASRQSRLIYIWISKHAKTKKYQSLQNKESVAELVKDFLSVCVMGEGE